MIPWRLLAPATRRGLMLALDAGRFARPYSARALRRYVVAPFAEPVAVDLGRLADLGISPAHVCEVLAALDDTGQHAPEATLVWAGPELVGAASRDRRVQLFTASANRSQAGAV